MKHLLKGVGLIFLAAQSLLPLLPAAMPVSVGWSRALDRLSAAAGIRATAHFTQATEQQPALARAGCVLQHSTAKLRYSPEPHSPSRLRNFKALSADLPSLIYMEKDWLIHESFQSMEPN